MRYDSCGPELTDDGRTATEGDGGPIDPEYQWEETVQVSNDEDE